MRGGSTRNGSRQQPRDPPKGYGSSSDGNPLQQNALTVEAVDRSNNWLKGVIETLSVLREWFPGAFAAGRFRSLKVGIDKDIAARAPAITGVETHRALGYHTTSERYLWSMRPGAPRVDLDGVEVGVVTADEAAHAKAILDLRKAKKAAKQRAATPALPEVAEPAPPQQPPPPPPVPDPTKRERDLEQARQGPRALSPGARLRGAKHGTLWRSSADREIGELSRLTDGGIRAFVARALCWANLSEPARSIEATPKTRCSTPAARTAI